MIGHRIANHFLPHYFVDPEFAGLHPQENELHHSAHGVSNKWLFIYLSLFLAFGVVLTSVRIQRPEVLGQTSISADEIINLTNAQRSANGLEALTFNPLLAQAAVSKAANMFAENYWAHNSPSGKTPWVFITAAGYKYVYAGENLARDFTDAGSVVDAWMNSPSHRENILDKNFKEIGVAVADGNLTGHNGILIVQMFGSGISQVPKVDNLSAQPSSMPKAAVQATSESVPLFQTPNNQNFETPIISSGGSNNSQAAVLSSRKLAIAKLVSFALVSFIFTIFVLEVVVASRREGMKVRSSSLSHLVLLAFILFVVWYAIQGAII